MITNSFEKYAPGFEYDDSVEIFEEWVEASVAEMDRHIAGDVLLNVHR
jgi:hypothetical protein